MATYSQPPTLAGCSVFPADNVWNTPIDKLPVDKNSATYVNNIGAGTPLHPDFGAIYGTHLTYVNGSQPKVPVTFNYAGESDKGPYPIPANVNIETGSDHHAFVIDTTNCIDYELFGLVKQGDGSWHAGSGAIFPLNSNQLRPDGWTSADAAGLPMVPGYVRYDEILSGHINHALRFTALHTRASAYIWPARHWASQMKGAQYPVFGQRFRLKANYDISSFPPHVQVILQALKTYGMILADNGGPWYVSGVQDARFNDTELNAMKRVIGSDFEAVDESGLMENTNSAQVKGATPPSDVPAGWVSVISKNSGLCLSVIGGDTAKKAGTALEQATCVNGTHQEFQFVKVSGGYKIQVRSSSLALDVSGGSTANGALIQQYTYYGTSNQIWNLVRTSDGYVEITSNKSGKCIDVNGISKADHAAIHQWTWWDGDNQKWSFVPAE